MGSLNIGKLYKRKLIWYFKITDNSGKRLQRSTGKTVKREAMEFAQQYLARLNDKGISPDANTLKEELARYLDPFTNPRYRQALLHKTSYTLGYAKQVARHASLVTDALQKRLPAMLALPVDQCTRRDMKEIQIAIVEERGHCRTAQHMFGTLKTIFTYLADDSIIIQSPAAGIPDIGYEAKKMVAIEPELIAWMIGRKDLFPSPRAWAFFTFLAMTGMRKSEGMAIDTEHIQDGTLMIDQQVSPHHDHMVKPKCGVIRVIPLSQTALAALATLEPDKEGRYFGGYKYSDIATDVIKIRTALATEDKDNKEVWYTITPHILRHSANTNLLVSGASPVLVAEYLAWKHQELVDMQRRYTHLVAMNLVPVADMLDKLYAPRTEKKVLQMKFS